MTLSASVDPMSATSHRTTSLDVLGELARAVASDDDGSTVRLRAARAAGDLLPGHEIEMRSDAEDLIDPFAEVVAGGRVHGVLVAAPGCAATVREAEAFVVLRTVAAIAASALDRIDLRTGSDRRRRDERERLERVLIRLRRLRDRDIPRPERGDGAGEEPDAETLERVELLRRTMAQSRPTLHGQPLRTLRPDGTIGRVEAVELLLRPHDREGRPMPPGQVLPVLERQTVSGALDRWVVAEALRWTPPGDGRLAVNLSGRSIGDARFGRWLLSAVSSASLPPGRLRFEISESAAVEDLTRATALFEELAALGCELALDDFGAPHGSPQLLTRMPFHVVKLDGALVAGLRDDGADTALLRSIFDVTMALGVRTVAEHVDGPDLLPGLAALGVDAVQGYGIGRPGPLREQELTELDAGQPRMVADEPVGV